MDNPCVILTIRILLLEEVKGENRGHNEEKSDNSVKDAEEALQARVIRIEDNEALISLKVHLEQLLEGDGQKNAADGNGDYVQRGILKLVIKVGLEGKGHRSDGNRDGQMHDRVFHTKKDYLQEPEAAQHEKRHETLHHAAITHSLLIICLVILYVVH